MIRTQPLSVLKIFLLYIYFQFLIPIGWSETLIHGFLFMLYIDYGLFCGTLNKSSFATVTKGALSIDHLLPISKAQLQKEPSPNDE